MTRTPDGETNQHRTAHKPSGKPAGPAGKGKPKPKPQPKGKGGKPQYPTV
jgi:hypothetical protein